MGKVAGTFVRFGAEKTSKAYDTADLFFYVAAEVRNGAPTPSSKPLAHSARVQPLGHTCSGNFSIQFSGRPHIQPKFNALHIRLPLSLLTPQNGSL